MTRVEWTSDFDFEKEVIRIARLLWPGAGIAGAVMIEGRERDGIFVTDDAIHIVECTTSRQKQKASDDIEKSIKLARQFKRQHHDKPVQCWFITSEEVTPDQRAIAINKNEFVVTALSYDAFRSRLIDASSYLAARLQYPFGSARNLKDESADVPKDAYVPIDLLRLNDSSIWSAAKLTDEVIKARLSRALLLADYGAGKSMTLRQLYFQLSDAYRNGKTSKFPVFLNLRDHSGQSDTVEVLERHARRIGFPRPDHLVRAWRAGYVILMLDGFDELSSTGWMAFNKKLKNVRYSTIEIVRRFIDESPKDVSVFISGRLSYFDSEEEGLAALGLKRDSVWMLSLNDFTTEQIQAFFQKNNVQGELPDWLPARPLLIGYLLVRGAISPQMLRGDEDIDAGQGWDALLEAVCEREARTHANIDASTLRQVLERLATIARTKGGISAPLTLSDMSYAFQSVVGTELDQKAETLLMRLPGVGPSSQATEGRVFIDSDFASACAAGEVISFINNPYGENSDLMGQVKEVLTESGVAVSSQKLEEMNVAAEKIYAALRRAVELGDKEIPSYELAGDLLKLTVMTCKTTPKDGIYVTLKEAIFDELDFSDLKVDLSSIELRNCAISNLYLPVHAAEDSRIPRFFGVEIGHIEGRTSENDLPAGKFANCAFDTFSESIMTNASVANLALDAGVKALVTILRKLFVQKGAGRKENAFYRGVIGNQGQIISEVLDLIESADYATKTKRGGQDPVWSPNRRMAGRVNAILLAPTTNREPIVLAARQIGASGGVAR